MEEQVGKIWDRLITRSARRSYPQAAVRLGDVEKTVGVLFRALGGDGGLRVVAGVPVAHGARRPWLQRLAGMDRRLALAGRDTQVLNLPAVVDVFPDKPLNRDLYLWLAAMAAELEVESGTWFERNQSASVAVLRRYPGMAARYARLVQALLALRPDARRLPPDEAAQERAIQRALERPGCVSELPAARRPPWPVPLWFYTMPTAGASIRTSPDEPAQRPSSQAETQRDKTRLRAERVPAPKPDRGILLYRFESLLSWAEYIKVDRACEDGDDRDARQAARDMDVLSVARDAQAPRSRLRFDLDLPPDSEHDTPLGDGLLLSEWDYRHAAWRPNHCRVETFVSRAATRAELPAHLKADARRLRRRFEAWTSGRVWLRAQDEGAELDVDAYVRKQAQVRHGRHTSLDGLFRDARQRDRDLACLLLADLSLSTDAWVNDQARVIDVVRDALYLFSEALSASGDAFALYGFSSRRREHVRLHTLKDFTDTYGPGVRRRIAAIKPGFYTRMGAAIRYASQRLAACAARQRLLLLLTDGKPNDLDIYEGRYGIEDTRMALREARRAGLLPFCVTIDVEADDYLPYLFGSQGYLLIRRPAELPAKLPQLYAHLAR